MDKVIVVTYDRLTMNMSNFVRSRLKSSLVFDQISLSK